jgi:hypothetical protein
VQAADFFNDQASLKKLFPIAGDWLLGCPQKAASEIVKALELNGEPDLPPLSEDRMKV